MFVFTDQMFLHLALVMLRHTQAYDWTNTDMRQSRYAHGNDFETLTLTLAFEETAKKIAITAMV